MQDLHNEVVNIFPSLTVKASSECQALCPVCVGMLGGSIDNSSLSQVLDAVKHFDYELKDFSASLSLPSSLTIRNLSLWKHLQKTYPSVHIGGFLKKKYIYYIYLFIFFCL